MIARRRGFLPKGLGGGCRLDVLEAVARQPERTVRDLAVELGLSYMGIKSQCVALEKQGYLSSRKKRRKQGRPEVLYSLAAQARSLLPSAGFPLAFELLEQSSRLFGKQSPQKLLFLFFQEKADRYARELKAKSPLQRAGELAALRDSEGYFAMFDPGPPAAIVQGHDPLETLLLKFPEAAKFETESLSRLLGVRLERVPGKTGQIRFEINPA